MRSNRVRVSFELYPPRKPEAVEATWETVQELAQWDPQCVSVTYPSTAPGRQASHALVQRIIAQSAVAPVAHLTVTGSSRADLKAHVRWLFSLGLRDVLALRGDPPPHQEWTTYPGGLDYASQLVELVHEVEREDGIDGVRVGCAVSAQPQAALREAEARYLLAKERAGADYAITQLFYDAAEYVLLVEAARAAGVTIPIIPGIIPLTDPPRLERLAALTGVAVPPAVAALAALPEAERFDRGIALTADLVQAAIAVGAERIHIFTFNQARPAAALCAELAERELLHPLPTKGLA
ncbi:MAG: methylenetetrahydrofolate reductase [Ruaniaceae bacterium]|nr:methylenetetrahydrofolate reductase [Ruaniaceae bacterium]